MNRHIRTLAFLGCIFPMSLLVTGCCKDKSGESAFDLPPLSSDSPAIPTVAEKKGPITKTVKIGEQAAMSDFILEVKEAKECKAKGYSRPKKDHKWIGADVAFEATGDKEFWANPTSAKVTDSEGMVHNVSYASQSSCGDHLKSARLNKGEKTKGWIIFEVPKDAKGFTMTFNRVAFLANDTVKIDLGF